MMARHNWMRLAFAGIVAATLSSCAVYDYGYDRPHSSYPVYDSWGYGGGGYYGGYSGWERDRYRNRYDNRDRDYRIARERERDRARAYERERDRARAIERERDRARAIERERDRARDRARDSYQRDRARDGGVDRIRGTQGIGGFRRGPSAGGGNDGFNNN